MRTDGEKMLAWYVLRLGNEINSCAAYTKPKSDESNENSNSMV